MFCLFPFVMRVQTQTQTFSQLLNTILSSATIRFKRMGFTFTSSKVAKTYMEDWERKLSKREIIGRIEIELPPSITSLIVLVNAMMFLGAFLSANPENVFESYGFTPAYLIEFKNAYSLFTHMFLHADVFHILLNMLMFLSFAPHCEQKMGKLRFLSFYLLSGILAAVFYFLFNMSSQIPVVGASGAIFGVLAAFVAFFPEEKIYLYVGGVPVKVPTIVAIPFIFLLETLFALIAFSPNIAHMAHVGGFIAGIILLASMYPKSARGFLAFVKDVLIYIFSD